jgi:hypothetical protein
MIKNNAEGIEMVVAQLKEVNFHNKNVMIGQ